MVRPYYMPRVAILLPCYNEGAVIASVVRNFKKALPEALVYVYDNNSTDDTLANALGAGAIVRTETRQGKGEVVRRMFADIEADVYVLSDGDGTYDPSEALKMIELLLSSHLDMVTGVRPLSKAAPHRTGHRLGNRIMAWTVGTLFGQKIGDLFSGYRVFSRRFVKSFPALSRGFEIETELTVHAAEMRIPTGEVEASYGKRVGNTVSKLRTVRDGFRIVGTIGLLLKEERPLQVFATLTLLLALTSLILGIPIVIEFVETGLVPRFPTAILALGLMLLAALSLTSGIIMDSIAHMRREFRRLSYLSYPPPAEL